MSELVKANTALKVKGLLERHKSAIVAALPGHISADRLFRVSIGAINRTPKLQQCTAESLFGAIVQASTLGLDPSGTLGEGYLVPYGKTCQFIPGYRGLINLARRTGEVSLFYAELVCENDTFAMKRGLHPDLEHEIPTTGERGPVIGAYAVFKTKDGEADFDYMTFSEIESIRKRSKAGQSGPWVTDWGEMAKKTLIRRLAKRAPCSVELANAMRLDAQAAMGEVQRFEDVQDLTGVEVHGQNRIEDGSILGVKAPRVDIHPEPEQPAEVVPDPIPTHEQILSALGKAGINQIAAEALLKAKGILGDKQSWADLSESARSSIWYNWDSFCKGVQQWQEEIIEQEAGQMLLEEEQRHE